MKNNIEGVGIALVTPFDHTGKIDFKALERLVEHVTAGGVDYLVVLGTTAETPTLDAAEKHDIISCVREKNAGRLPIIVGAGGNSTAQVISHMEKCDTKDISAFLTVTPYYNKPTQEGLYLHYKAIAGSASLPVLLYNVPSRTGINMTAETTLRLAWEFPGAIMGIKEACGSVQQMARILKHRPEGFKVISGDDCLAIPLAAIGGDGIISVVANAFPRVFCQMMAASADGNNKLSTELFLRIFDMIEAIFEEGNPAGIKAALSVLGVAGSNVRLPLAGPSEELSARIRSLIATEEL